MSEQAKHTMPWSWRSTPRNDDGTMSIVEHLYELRNRLIKAVVFMFIGGVLCYIFYNNILDLLTHPYCSLPAKYRPSVINHQQGCRLPYFGPVDGLFVRIKTSAVAGFVITMPFWVYQIWAFITPGLKKNERKYALSFLFSSTVLFALGAGLAYVVLEKGLHILMQQSGSNTFALLEVGQYLSFVLTLVLVFGISFEFPLVVVMLNLVGVLTHERLMKWQRYIIFLVFAFSAVATPTGDPFTMSALAVPMCLLFEVAVLAAWRHDKRKRARVATEYFHDIPDDEASPMETAPTDIAERSTVDSSHGQADQRH